MKYPIMESFHSIQGEGAHSGTPAYFIRLGGCDVGCVWCDVKDSWDASKHPQIEHTNLVQEAKKSGAPIVVITGGEPAMYDLTPLCQGLHEAGLKTHIETSGCYEIKGDFDWVCFSPKKFKAPIDSAIALADELKVIVFNRSDLDWAEQFAKLVPNECALFLQPEWDKREVVKDLMLDHCLKEPKWRISLQTHKYLGVD